ncbi:MAG: CHAD domain-containing protein [Candidatus Binatia bacterium]
MVARIGQRRREAMRADAIPQEVEVKLAVDSADTLGRIARLRRLGDYGLRPRGIQHLHTVYLDTAALSLARSGVALRVRRNGRRWEATAKWPGQVAGALHERPELTMPLRDAPGMPFELPDGPLRDRLRPFALGRPLQPILITEVERRRLDLQPAAARSAIALAELALDTVQVLAPNAEPAADMYWEVEIEQRAGSRDDCVAAGRELQRQFGLPPSPDTKFARGLRAVYGAAAPSENGALRLTGADTVAAATRKVLALHLARLRASDHAVRSAPTAEPLHDMRVAVRRMRSTLRLGRHAFPPRQRAALARELRWLGRELGRVRDLDVQRALLHARRDGTDPRRVRGLHGYGHHLTRRHAAARAALLAALDSRRYRQLLLALERATQTPARPPRGRAAEPMAERARRAVKRASRRLLERGEALGELPEPDQLHALRIRVKRLRYTVEAIASLGGRTARVTVQSLTALQDALGSFNDSMVAARTIRSYRDGVAGSASDEVRQALDQLADAELRRTGVAQADFRRAWKRFRAKAARRERKNLLRTLGQLGAPAAEPAAVAPRALS